MGKFHHDSHGFGPVREGHAVPGNLARDGSPKKIHAIEVHPGMVTKSKGGDVFGGDHKSALDSVSGNVIVPGAVTTAPGYGNAGVQSGHPFAKPPGSKRLTRVAPAFGMRSRSATPHDGEDLHELGAAVLAEAVRCK